MTDESAPREPLRVNVQLKVPFEAVKPQFAELGFVLEQELSLLHVVIGTIETDRVDALAQVDGVGAVEPEREVGIMEKMKSQAPPSSPIRSRSTWPYLSRRS